jgi:soluble epoxide hydrolase/lipid-phosphate phosphatase
MQSCQPPHFSISRAEITRNSFLLYRSSFICHTMAPDKLTPKDSRIQHKYANLNGQRYHYLLGTPDGPIKATIFLIHGWPDYSFGWRYQVPFLISMGLRVVVPDMMGYGGTDAPQSLEFYTLKRAASDMAELAKQLDAPQIILLGHDWGGAIVYRIALWQPQLITAVIAVCTPYTRPNPVDVDLADMVNTTLPNFRYQLQLASGEVEKKIGGEKANLRLFLNALYGGWGANGTTGFIPEHGVLYDNLPLLKKTTLLSDEELDYYAESYTKNGLRGTLNWYRTRSLNWRDEKEMAAIPDLKIKQPTMFVLANRDAALPPRMSRGQDKNFVDYTQREVSAGHWCLWQKPEEVNAILKEFLEEKVLSSSSNKPKL